MALLLRYLYAEFYRDTSKANTLVGLIFSHKVFTIINKLLYMDTAEGFRKVLKENNYILQLFIAFLIKFVTINIVIIS